MEKSLDYQSKLKELGHPEEVLALILKAVEHFGLPRHEEPPEDVFEGAEFIEKEDI